MGIPFRRGARCRAVIAVLILATLSLVAGWTYHTVLQGDIQDCEARFRYISCEPRVSDYTFATMHAVGMVVLTILVMAMVVGAVNYIMRGSECTNHACECSNHWAAMRVARGNTIALSVLLAAVVAIMLGSGG